MTQCSLVTAGTRTVPIATLLECWEGWGTSLSWWANVFGEREDIADLLLTNKTAVALKGAPDSLPELGFNVARYNLGSSGNNVIDDSGTEIAMKASEDMPSASS